MNAQLIPQFIDFLERATTPYHAVSVLVARLQASGYAAMPDDEAWQPESGGKYYVTGNGSSIIAFQMGTDESLDSGFRMLGAHTDSPCLRVKPNPDLYRHGYHQLGVEVYGGALLNPWFDRDLSLAGRVSLVTGSGEVSSALLDFKRPVAVIPSLAIHLDREANKQRSINPQEHLPVLLGLADDSGSSTFQGLLEKEFARQYPDRLDCELLDYEMMFYDTQPASCVGVEEEFLAGARLDNLLSCFATVQALIDGGDQRNRLVVCNDHEEVGSVSAVGAQGPMLKDMMSRLYPDQHSRVRALRHSMMISVDNAHGIHPNFADRHDANHGPILNRGPVIKINNNQRYASTSETAAAFRHVCRQAGVPVQSFVVRSDMACGSTIGPLTAAELGVRTLDLGVPTFGMHSIRELAGCDDIGYLVTALCEFMSQPLSFD